MADSRDTRGPCEEEGQLRPRGGGAQTEVSPVGAGIASGYLPTLLCCSWHCLLRLMLLAGGQSVLPNKVVLLHLCHSIGLRQGSPEDA